MQLKLCSEILQLDKTLNPGRLQGAVTPVTPVTAVTAGQMCYLLVVGSEKLLEIKAAQVLNFLPEALTNRADSICPLSLRRHHHIML